MTGVYVGQILWWLSFVDTSATIIAESNLAVTFELRTIAMILVAMYDAEHSTRSVDDELNWKKDIARRLR